jgi:hypothetical protein
MGLIVIPLLVLADLAWTGRLSPVLEPDSGTYLEFDWSSPTTILGGFRTFGYPAFLKFAALFGRDNAAVPFLQWLAATLAAWACFWGLRRGGYRDEIAFWCAATLMLNREMLDFGNLIMSDSLATSLALTSFACFLACMARTTTILDWFGMAALTFLTYQVRPAYIFLIPLWPMMAFLLDLFLLRRTATWGRRLFHFICMTFVTVLPFVAFCSLRGAVVGHWGLVSFGGCNVVGIAGQLLDRELAAELPQSIQQLANRIVDAREQRTDTPGPVDYESFENSYNPIVWGVAVPIAKELQNNDVIAVNRDLTNLSKEILRRRPVAYLRCLLLNAKHAFSELLQLTFRDRGTLFVVFVAFLFHGWSLLRGPVQSRSAEANSEDLRIESHLLFWSAIGFASAKSLLVILVEPSIGRYMTAAMALLPPAIAVFLAQQMHSRASESKRSSAA